MSGAPGLELQLQGLRPAEQQRAGEGPQGVPLGEDHQGDGDEAAPGGHVLGPGEGQGQGQVGAGQPAQHAPRGQGLVPAGRPGSAPGGEGGGGALAHRPDAQAPAGAEQGPPDQDGHRQRPAR